MDYLVKAIERLKKHEGLRLRMYKCTEDKITIGYGHNLDANGITESQADMILADDVGFFLYELRENFSFFEDLPDAAKDVLVNMCFNLGIARLKGFKNFLQAVENQEWGIASVEMMDSRWARQVGKRAVELKELILTLA